MKEFLTNVGIKEVAYGVTFLIYAVERFIALRRHRKKKNASPVETSSDLNSTLYPMLSNIMMDYNAIRVYLIQFHNGDTFYSGQDLLKMTVSHEVKRSNYKAIAPSISGVVVDDHIHKIAARLRVDNVLQINDLSEIEDDEVRLRYSYLGAVSLCFYPIRNKKKRIIGILCLHHNHRQAMNDNDNLGVRHVIYEISNALSHEKS